MAPPEISIIIPVKNGERYLDEVLAGIYGQQTAYTFEVILIDSGSSDRSLEIAARYPLRLHQIPPASFNHGGTRNLGGQLAHPASRYLVYLTQDATPRPGWLDCLVASLEQDPQVAGAFSRHAPRPDCNPILARQMQEDWEQCGTPARVEKQITDRTDFEQRKVHYVYFADTSSCLRRSVWEQYPYPVTDFAEDAQWAETVLLAGYRIIYEPASQVLHSHSFPLADHYRRNYEHARAMRRFVATSSHTPVAGNDFLLHTLHIVWRDWRFLWRQTCQSWWWKLYWSLFSPIWHGAAGLGSRLGANADGRQNLC